MGDISVKKNRIHPLFFVLLFTFGMMLAFQPLSGAADYNPEKCVKCHIKKNPGIIGQWKSSEHFKNDISCYDCHGAETGEPDAFRHMGAVISVIVSPKDCSECHDKEFEEQKGSHHAKAGQILGSLDNLLGEIIGGSPIVNAGCRQCHGSKVEIDDRGKPTLETWPNTGMGWINPAGSRGSCAACHTRHEFSIRQARQPESCGKCHLGPDHPQIEVWNESKHGILYHANRENMKLGAEKWRSGIEYVSGPTCASCHMSEAGKQGVTHDVGERISWTLRPPMSIKLNMIIITDNTKEDITGDKAPLPKAGSMYKAKSGRMKKVKKILTWNDRRDKMKDVCRRCHGKGFIKVAGKEVARELLEKYVYTIPGHKWHRDGMSKEQLQLIQKFYKDRYKQ